MRLSKKAIIELKKVLESEIGLERTEVFSDEELNELGILLLSILQENLKIKFIDTELSVSSDVVSSESVKRF